MKVNVRAWKTLAFFVSLLLLAEPRTHAAPLMSGLEIWLDAGTITPVADGTTLTGWADASGNGRDLTSAFAGTGPTYQSSEINGLPVVRFTANGFQSSFDLADNFSITGTTFFVVFKSSSTTQGTFLSLNGPAENQSFLYNNRYSSGDLFGSFDGSSGDNSGSQDLNGPYNTGGTPHLFTAYGDSGANMVFLRADGGAETNFYTDAVLLGDIDNYTVGVLNNGTSSEYNGDIAEILVYNRTLSISEIGEVEVYLLGKYAIPEPSSAVCLLLGLGALVYRRRRS